MLGKTKINIKNVKITFYFLGGSHEFDFGVIFSQIIETTIFFFFLGGGGGGGGRNLNIADLISEKTAKISTTENFFLMHD